MRTSAQVADRRSPPPRMRTTPSISGASLLERAIATSSVDPVDQHLHGAARLVARSRSALISAASSMKRARRSCLTSSGTAARAAHWPPRPRPANIRSSRRGRAAPRAASRAARSKSASVSPGKPTMKVLRIVMSGTTRRQAAMRSKRVLGGGRALHQLQDARAGVLERNVEIGQHLSVGHQLDHLVDVRVRIDVVQPNPHAELAQRRAPDRRSARGVPRRATAARRISGPRHRRWCPARSPGVPSRRRARAAPPRAAPRRSGRLTRRPRIEGMMQKLQ